MEHVISADMLEPDELEAVTPKRIGIGLLTSSVAHLQENRDIVADALEVEEYEAGDPIYRQGDIGDRLLPHP